MLPSITYFLHNLEYYTCKFLVHSIDAKKKVQLHRPIANLASSKEGVYYATIKMFNKLPAFISELIEDKKHFNCLILLFN
jgi:hypothetical protein